MRFKSLSLSLERFCLLGALLCVLTNGVWLHAQAALANPNPNNWDTANIVDAMRHPHYDLVILAAHRGTHALERPNDTPQAPLIPENSLASIGAAAQAGWESIEIDVKLTSDGTPILSHDQTWGREWCGRGFADARPFDPLSSAADDFRNPKVSETTLSDTRSFLGHTVLRDSVSAVNGTTYLGCDAGVSYFGEYPPTLQDVYDYVRNNHIQMVLALDIKDAATAKEAWKVVLANNDDQGRPFAQSTLFKVPAIAFPTTAVYLDTFGSDGRDYSKALFNPVFHTSGIAADSFGSEAAMNQWIDIFRTYNSPAPIDIVAIEVSMKEWGVDNGSILSTVQNKVSNLGTTISQFQTVPEHYPNGDATQEQFFNSGDGTCCYTQDKYLFNYPYHQGPTNPDLPYDHDDHRGDPDFLSLMDARMITTDRPDLLSDYFLSRGERNTSYMRATGSNSSNTAIATVSLSSPKASVKVGDQVLLSIAISGNQSMPTGTVGIYDGQALVSTVNVSGPSVGQVVSLTSEGNHVFKAIYSGNSTYSASTSNAVTVVAATAVRNGTYYITNVSSGQIMEVNEGTNPGVIDQWGAYSGQTNQQWQVTSIGNNLYQLVAIVSNQCLTVYGASTQSGGTFVQYPCNGGTNQQFVITPTTSGSYTMTVASDGLVVEDPNFSTDVGAQVDQWGLNGGTNQQWTFTLAPNAAAGSGSGVNPSNVPPLRLLPLGDSITWGYADSTGNGYRSSLLTQMVDEGLTADFVGTLENGQFQDNWNEGHSGYTIEQISALIDPVLAKYQPNVITLMIGTNNCNLNDNPTGAPSLLTSLISQIYSDDPNVAIALATLIPSTTPAWESCIQNINSQIPGIVAQFQSQGKHIIVADMSAITVDELVDGVHPDAAGYQQIANGFLTAVNQMAITGWIQTAASCSSIPAGCNDPAILGVNGTTGTTGSAGTPQPRQAANGWTPVGSVAGGSSVRGIYRYADMDGDGKADFVVIDPTTGALTVYLNKGTDYPTFGGWAPPIAFAAGAAPASRVILADVTGDGKADYLIVDPTTGAVTAWQNNGGDNGGNGWSSLGQVARGAAPGILVSFADVNGDGKADYLIVNEITGAITAWINNGMDVSGGEGWTNIGQVAAGGGPRTMVRFADLNGDGFADYILVNPVTGAITAWLNNGMDISGGHGWTPLGQIGRGAGSGALVQFADINGDHAADYLVVSAQNGQTNGYLNNGGDTTALTPTLPTPAELPQQTQGNGWLVSGIGSVAGGSSVSGMIYRYADMNGDGKADFVTIDPNSGALTVYLNNGTDYPNFGGWGTPIAFAAGAAPGAQVVLADITGDRKADYLIVDPTTGAVTAWQNNGGDNGGNGWGYLGLVARGAAPAANVRFADVNGDGVADYLILDPNTGAMTAWLNEGMDLAGGSGWVNIGQVAAGGGPGAEVQLADINGDGYADYMVTDANSGIVKAWLNNGMDVSGGGGWTPLVQWQGVAGAQVQFAPLYTQGFADYLVVAPNNGQTNGWLNNGAGLSQ